MKKIYHLAVLPLVFGCVMTTREDPVRITLVKDGSVLLQSHEYRGETLQPKLASIYNRTGGTSVELRCDPQTSCGFFFGVLETCLEAGFWKFQLTTLPGLQPAEFDNREGLPAYMPIRLHVKVASGAILVEGKELNLAELAARCATDPGPNKLYTPYLSCAPDVTVLALHRVILACQGPYSSHVELDFGNLAEDSSQTSADERRRGGGSENNK